MNEMEIEIKLNYNEIMELSSTIDDSENDGFLGQVQARKTNDGWVFDYGWDILDYTTKLKGWVEVIEFDYYEGKMIIDKL